MSANSEGAAQTPPGFTPLAIASGFAADFGPIYIQREGERVLYAFRIEERHLNPFGVAHGGALATFADMQLAAFMRAGRLIPKRAPTISLSLDYLAPARLGDWVQGEIMLVKRTGRLAFAETILTVDGAPVARTKGLFAYSEAGASLDLPPPPPPPAAPDLPPPEGFAPLDPGAGFGVFFGPMACDPERLQVGFRVGARHINLFGVCHGGALAMLADYQLAPLRRAGIVTGPFAPTLSLNVDYLAPARIGDWIAAEAVLVRATGRYLFTQAVLSGPDGPVARSTAIYAMRKPAG